MVAALAVFGLLIAGTLNGDDDQFPFGPFRMYASAVDNNGAVRSLSISGVDDQGRPVAIRAGLIGMRPAEFEGQLSRLIDNPPLVDSLARSYRSHQHGGQKLSELRLVERSFQLVNGRQVGEATERVVAIGHAT
ncbi:MAG: uncharacterized protein JWL70_2110 [Acidimicrobiia bacterium]|nr:uncharacterized protein [Acidimicrobiia bacterium]